MAGDRRRQRRLRRAAPRRPSLRPRRLSLEAHDRDGDTVTLTLNPDAKPPPAGITFDEVEWLIEWPLPTLDDKGSNAIKFLVDDGMVVVKVERKVKVETSLLGW